MSLVQPFETFFKKVVGQKAWFGITVQGTITLTQKIAFTNGQKEPFENFTKHKKITFDIAIVIFGPNGHLIVMGVLQSPKWFGGIFFPIPLHDNF